MTVVLLVLEVVLGVYVSAYVAYQLMLFIANAVIADPPPFAPATMRAFNVIIPAHNEELFISRLLSSLQAQNYPADRYRVTVVADNCTDRTASVSRAFDVDVLERFDETRRSKGYAIGWTLERIAGRFDAVAIVDGDSVVAPEFLQQLNLQMERGDRVIQCYNGVINPKQSWFTRLMYVSRTMANEIIHPAKRKLGLSSHLMGNGMCFDLAVLRAFGWNAFSVGEDWEYYARLVLSGTDVGYSRGARVYHQESTNLQQASSQRMRWSSSRFQVLRRYGPPLLMQGLRTGSVKCVDAALPLLFPNPSLGMNLTLVGLVIAATHWAWSGSSFAVVWFSALAFVQLVMFLVSALYTDDKMGSAMSLVAAPLFLVWKLGIDVLSVVGVRARLWKPTERRL